jgi:AraC-like DNA-binding protein
MLDGSVRVLAGGRGVCTPDWGRDETVPFHLVRLYFPVSGTAWMEREGVRVRFRPDWIYLIPGDRPVRSGCDREMVVDWLHTELSGAVFGSVPYRLGGVYSWNGKAMRTWRSTYRSIQRIVSNPKPAATARLISMVMALYAKALEQRGAGIPTSRETGLIERIGPAVEYMDNHDTANPSLAEVAASVHLSAEHFHRIFSEVYGQTPYYYMLSRRMRIAMRYLTTTDLSIGQVGVSCGYDNPFYFSRAFKRYFGVSPSTARRGEYRL